MVVVVGPMADYSIAFAISLLVRSCQVILLLHAGMASFSCTVGSRGNWMALMNLA